MPIDLDLARLDDGDGIEETLRKINARYHHSCRLLFNNTKLERKELPPQILKRPAAQASFQEKF